MPAEEDATTRLDAVRARRLEHAQRADDVDLGVANRVVDRARVPDARGQVEDDVAALGGRLGDARRGHVAVDELGVGAEVLRVARGQVVEDDDLVPLGQQQLDEVAADEPCAAGDQCLHPSPPGPTRGTSCQLWCTV